MRIECNNDIIICQGDKGFINFKCGNHLLKEGDTIEFEIKELGLRLVVNTFDNGIGVFDITENITQRDKKTYEYIIRVITKEGYDETVIKGKFIII